MLPFDSASPKEAAKTQDLQALIDIRVSILPEERLPPIQYRCWRISLTAQTDLQTVTINRHVQMSAQDARELVDPTRFCPDPYILSNTLAPLSHSFPCSPYFSPSIYSLT